MATRSYQNHSGIGFRRNKAYADEADKANLNIAIIALRNAKDARNSTMFLKELRRATMMCQAVWRTHNN